MRYFGRRRSAEVKVGPLIVLGLVAIAAAGFWYARSTSSGASGQVDTDTFAAWCAACKKDIALTAADAKNVAKQGDKIQCPLCKKFEANWGPAPLAPPKSGDGGMMQP